MTAVRPFNFTLKLDNLKHDLLEQGHDIEYFHASEEAQPVRDRVFAIIQEYIDELRIDSLIVEKRKVEPALRKELRFYPEMLRYLLRYLVESPMLAGIDEILFVTDLIPLNKKRKAIEKAIRINLGRMLKNRRRYRIMHHASKSSYGLQVADYCNWAIYRKWNTADARSYNLIKEGITSEYEIFAAGSTHYY
ncbi:MAG: DUF3800 domain-containing protein [SAR324 cluster bacterium]|nr:DUF3800 domain-containing protein [SAR324 cluster bacterium]